MLRIFEPCVFTVLNVEYSNCNERYSNFLWFSRFLRCILCYFTLLHRLAIQFFKATKCVLINRLSIISCTQTDIKQLHQCKPEQPRVCSNDEMGVVAADVPFSSFYNFLLTEFDECRDLHKREYVMFKLTDWPLFSRKFLQNFLSLSRCFICSSFYSEFYHLYLVALPA